MIPLPEICDLADLAASLRSGAFPLLDYLGRIAACFDAHEPEVRAFTAEGNRWARLRSDAQGLLARYPDPASRPLLFGVPIAVKDVLHVSGLPTRAGSTLPTELLTGAEGACVGALKRAGALILGKTHTTEFAFRAPAPTRNPYHAAHTPGGSSSGSAAAVGAGMAPLALGTQTIGSTNRPAAYCGIAGFKPSYARLPLTGVIPLAPSLDHLGLLAPGVADIAFVFSVLTGLRSDDRPSRRPVFGIPTGPYLASMTAAMAAHFYEVTHRLTAAGFKWMSVPVFDDLDEIAAATQDLLAAEAWAVHQRWYGQFADRYRPQTVALLERGRTIPVRRIQQARALRLQLRDRCRAERARFGFDYWLTPAATGPAPRALDATGDAIMQLPWTLSGLPVVNFPTGFLDGLPVGVQVVGEWYGDADVLRVGALLEGVFGSRY